MKNQELKKQLMMTLVTLKGYTENLRDEYFHQDEVDEELENFLEKSVDTMDNLVDLITWLEEE
jgi:hypothetical protein